jgi:ligand-binding SRPBCC domain-containing protein
MPFLARELRISARQYSTLIKPLELHYGVLVVFEHNKRQTTTRNNRMSTTPLVVKHVFEKSSLFDTTMAHMIHLHETSGPAALTPPPIFVQVHRDTRTSLNSGELEFTLWFALIPFRWLARHEPGPTPTSFADVMVRGPLAYWRHEHIFSEEVGGVRLTDRVTLAHHSGPRGWLTRLMFDGLPLRLLFFYRHLKTRWMLSRMKRQAAA